MNTGPRATQGFDLCLTELLDGQRHEFLVETGSARGANLLSKLPHRPASESELTQVESVTTAASQAMRRAMVPEVAALLKRNPEHPRWQEVAQRCLSCANCTQVCPTCFCSTVEDVTDLDGQTAERWRQWDSCFTIDFSYIHGGSIRRETRSRYRQWLTHKLSTWHDQFDTSGCVGCGRCITWCPAGIDLTEEAGAIQDSEGGTGHAHRGT
jgi:ferredoxin